MIPRLDVVDVVDPLYQDFLTVLQARGFKGDIDIRYGARLAVATDNSVYQQVPQAVVHPKTIEDIELISKLASEQVYQSIQFSARGGGTGTNGQSLTPGLVVDLSRHMNAILDINLDEGWVKVQAGVIKDQLNDFLRPHGYFFAPDLSTSNRATIGGMINTDASGQGSLVYGKTSDHVLGITSVLADGTRLATEKMPTTQAQIIAKRPTSEGEVYRQALASCLDNRDLILEKFPRLNRFLTGYDLENVFNDDLSEFDLSRLITGSEGTLAFVVDAKLNITPISKAKVLVNIKYDSFDSALRHSPALVKANATSVETIDSKVLNLAKGDIIWHSVSDLITEDANTPMDGLNIVEFNGESQEALQEKLDLLEAKLKQDMAADKGVLGYQMTSDAKSIGQLYAMRKKAVGLLGKTDGSQKPLAFAEDTAVPPENLADFIAEFRELLDSYDLHYGMFGHVDAGVLHVRPALDMCDPAQEVTLREISDKVVALTAKYGGLMWGEHGKGYRSEYGPEFFGEALFKELRKIKSVFDPHNKLNPGKICTPLESDENLVSVDDVKRGYFDRQIPVTVRDDFGSALNCNGNGLCFNYDAKSVMCPSSKITRDRRHSPKGRAGLMREWLRLLAAKGIDPRQLEQAMGKGSATVKVKQVIDKVKNTYQKLTNNDHYDFSDEVLEAMDGCLACKACVSQCPINVDVPEFKARFVNLYYTRYMRPLKDHLVANVEMMAPVMATMPRLVNTVLSTSVYQKISEKTIGYINTPLLSVPTLKDRVGRQYREFDLQYLKLLAPHRRKQTVLIVQDPFTTFYDAQVVEAFMNLAFKLGFNPMLLPFKPNGKPQHIKGFLDKFAKTAKNAADFLNEIAELDIPMVGMDASLVLCYRDEYKHALKDERGDFDVQLAHEWLVENLSDKDLPQARNLRDYQLFGHCTEKTALPKSEKQWAEIFAKFGLTLNAATVGCCGMAGTYGHEKSNFERSKGIYNLSWQPRISELKPEQQLATGFSCRSQVKRLSGLKVRHPVQALLEELTEL